MSTPTYKPLANPSVNLQELIQIQNDAGATAGKLSGSEPFDVLASKAIFNNNEKASAVAASSITIAGTVVPLGGSITESAQLDSISSTRGTILYRGAAGWSPLAPGTAGYLLSTNGAGADPAYIAAPAGSLPSQTGKSGTRLTTNGTTASWVYDPNAIALAPAQALSSNGTAGSTLTLSALGSGGLSFAAIVTVPSWPTSGQRLLIQGGTDSLSVGIDSNGKLNCEVPAVAVRLTSTAAIALDTPTHVCVTRTSAGVWCIYINGILDSTATTAVDNLTATSYYIGQSSGGASLFVGVLRPLGLLNYAKTAAEVLAVYQTGSFPASDFNSASNTATYTSDFSAGVDSWEVAAGIASVTGNVDGVGGLDNWLKYTLGAANALGIYRNANLVAAAGKRYRYTFTIRHNSATVTSIKVYEYGNATNGVTGIAVAPNTNVTVTVDLPNPSAAANYLIIQTEQVMAIGDMLYLRAFTAYNLGLLVAPDPAQPGNGLAWGDRSGNGAHILLPTSGVDWLLPSAAVNKLRGTTSTSGNQQLLGGTTLNANTQITHVRARSRSGTPSITLGTASGGSQIVASVALSTTWKDLTIALTGGIISTASSVWVGSSTADVVEIDLTHEPLGY